MNDLHHTRYVRRWLKSLRWIELRIRNLGHTLDHRTPWNHGLQQYYEV